MVYEHLGIHPAAWAGKSATEIQEIAAVDGSMLVVPVGSTEQHGPHLPVATDTILADAISHAGLDRVSDLPALVTPPVWTGYSPHHLSFGGTISLEHDDLLALLEDVARTALENDFDALAFVNGHGGNSPAIKSATSTVGVEHAGVEVVGLTYFELAAPFVEEIRKSDRGGMSHAGEFETSLMLHLRSDLVSEDRAEATPQDSLYTNGLHDMFAGGPLSVYREFREYSETGAIGAPELATAETGAELYDRLGDELAVVLREVHQAAR
jgi:creatinine amidohydrolase